MLSLGIFLKIGNVFVTPTKQPIALPSKGHTRKGVLF